MTLDPARKAELEEKMRAYVGLDVGETLMAPDLVNEAMIRHWCVVMGDENPVYNDPNAAAKSVHGGIVAPPTMMNAWVMPPYIPPWALTDDDGPAPNKEVELHRLLASRGQLVVPPPRTSRFERDRVGFPGRAKKAAGL